ncbi:hypothetical protein CLV90_1000 [Maribacter spongiicola]|uniref:Uncharacterized protein n=1 Tax=Maribacter spongiicola TaxID=1206753 RepID=A0A4R7K6N1_9FLAO|nr:BfmA/BtgA family mobilization protein [Maribacter spongiicola]TDT46935.1 hypothetical protein CLV90_1000 [Maribacter spongiicola]
MSKKSILVNEIAHKDLSKLVVQFNSNFGQLVGSMIQFFKKTGINPNEPLKDNPSILVKKLDNRIVSFLKVQERDILKPMRADIYQYHKSNDDRVHAERDFLTSKLNETNDKLDNILMEIRKQRQVHLEVVLFLDSKNKTGLLNRVQSILK